MATSRPFAYNTGSTITGTQQFGNLAIGTASIAYEDLDPGGLQWWNGPDEDLGYVIAFPVPGGDVPTPTNVSASLRFRRSPLKTENSFVNTVNTFYNQSFTTGQQANSYLSSSGFWSSWTSSITSSGLILNWNLQDLNSYNGSGTTITDLQGNSNGTLTGTITYTSATPNYLTIQGTTTEYINTNTGLNSKLSPVNTGTSISVFVWAYPTSNGTILSEQGQTPPDTGWYDSQIELVGGTMKFRVWPLGSPYISSTIATPLNNWYYLGLTYNGTTLTAYVNGQNAGSTTMTRQSPGNNGFNLFYNLGYPTATNMGSGAGSTFRFGALHVYNKGLTSVEVLSNYNNTKGTYGL